MIEGFKLSENGYRLLSELRPDNLDFQNALVTVKQELRKDKESQNDFYAEIENAESFDTNIVIVHLWYKKDYE